MAKSKAAAPKKAGGGGGSKFDIQQFLLDKGEKIGLIIAGVAFALFAILGVMAMSGAANPSKLSSELKGGAERIDAQLRETPGEAPPPADVPPGDITFVKVKPSQFVTPNELFNTSGTITEKRNNPIVLAIAGGEAVYAQGGIPVYDIQENNIATIQGREKTMNNVRAIDIEKLRKRQEKLRAKLGLPPPSATPTTPAPPAGGPPAAPPGPPGGGRGPGAAIPQKRSDDAEIVYVSLDSPSVNNAELALNLAPTRMAVIRGIVPYKKQVGKFLQALRVESDSALESEGSAPLYRGFSVERQTLKADGKTVEKDWTPFDPIDAARDLYRLAAALEPEDVKYEPFIPDATHKLYLPRPKFTRAGSPAPAMPELGQALQELEKTGPPKDLTDREKKLKGKDNLFDLRPQAPQPANPGGFPPSGIPGM
ncbi:MAG: hypothetical protein K1X57_22365, partial [Gemmataceae bacterium]|nr:hypothetical protein [Gemmataceae bacterium]